MKKQINPTIKAYLIRGAFYLLLLLAVCAIPFALAQRNGAKRPVINTAPKMDASAQKYMAQVSKRIDGAVSDQPLPKAPGTLPSHDARSAHPGNQGPVQVHGFPSTNRPLGTSGLLWYNGDFNGINGLA